MYDKRTLLPGMVDRDIDRKLRRRRALTAPVPRQAVVIGAQRPGGTVSPPPPQDVEPYLGLPAADNYILQSLLDGTRSWVPAGGSVILAIRRSWMGI